MRHSAQQGQTRSVFLNLIVLLVFMGLLGALITYFNSGSPELKKTLLKQVSKQMATSSAHAHWQWQAEGRPRAIMLVHYNPLGKETGRMPVNMDARGHPLTEQDDEGCEKLWRALLDTPMRLDGFMVRARYIKDTQRADGKGTCRFGLSRGSYFVYDITSGETHFVD